MEAGIPDKLFYRIGEVARITSLRPSVLRYWETEFDQLQPQKSRSGQRLYTRNELAFILDIKRLLYSEKLTIEGARRVVAKRRKERGTLESETDHPAAEDLLLIVREVREDLKKIRESL